MNTFKAAIIAIISASSSSLVHCKIHSLRAGGVEANNDQEWEDKTNDGDSTTTATRNLQENTLGLCNKNGKTVAPGQWLQGPERTCMCDRFGSQKFIDCVENGFKATPLAAGVARTAMGARQEFEAKDFVFDLLGSIPLAITEGGGTAQVLTVAQLPSLANTGLSMVLVNLEPCAINPPHTHPRATELIYMISGKDLRTAFVEENGGRVIVNDIGMGETTFFPEGLIHYQQNLSCEPVMFLATLSSEDPGAVSVATQFFKLPEEAQLATLNQSANVVNALIAGLPTGPAPGRQECLSKCGL
jgi:oxalate decarboxylase/phosphoglucose isomerase-like protein (cupin superfamily)